jgi:hypothetical protein
MKAIEAAGLSFILGMRIPDVPSVISQWCQRHPGEPIPDGHVFVQPWPAGPTDQRNDQVRYYQYKHDRVQRTLKALTSRSARPSRPWPARPRSSAIGSSAHQRHQDRQP